MSAYIFVAAAALAVLPILFIFKICIEQVKDQDNPINGEKVQTKFFLWVALIEALPILLIVLGFMNQTTAASIEELYAPGLIVFVLMGFATLFIFLQKSIGVPKEQKEFINTFSMVGLAIANAIPIMSIVAIAMMVP